MRVAMMNPRKGPSTFAHCWRTGRQAQEIGHEDQPEDLLHGTTRSTLAAACGFAARARARPGRAPIKTETEVARCRRDTLLTE